jgi:hypothetical protein
MIVELDKHKRLAKQIMDNPDMVEFLKAVFLPERSTIRTQAEQFVLAQTDADYGQSMKVLFLTEKHFQECFAKIKQLGASTDLPSTPVAPK